MRETLTLVELEPSVAETVRLRVLARASKSLAREAAPAVVREISPAALIWNQPLGSPAVMEKEGVEPSASVALTVPRTAPAAWFSS